MYERVDENLDGPPGDSVEESRVVRPYTLTRGRTRPERADLPLEAQIGRASCRERV